MIDKLIYNCCGSHLQRITSGDKRLIRIYSTESDGSVERDEKKTSFKCVLVSNLHAIRLLDCSS